VMEATRLDRRLVRAGEHKRRRKGRPSFNASFTARRLARRIQCRPSSPQLYPRRRGPRTREVAGGTAATFNRANETQSLPLWRIIVGS
jgi:hypothetical protein